MSNNLSRRERLLLSGVTEHSIFIDILLTLLTFGLFNLWVQIRQIQDTNEIIGKDSYSFFWVAIFSILTLGLYFCYHEYKLTKTLNTLVNNDSDEVIPFIAMIATFLGLWFIVDSYQQSLINQYLEEQAEYPSQTVDPDK